MTTRAGGSTMALDEVARASTDVASPSSRREKVERLSRCLTASRCDEVRVAVAYLSGSLPHGSIGVGWATLRDVPRARRVASEGPLPQPRRPFGCCKADSNRPREVNP